MALANDPYPTAELEVRAASEKAARLFEEWRDAVQTRGISNRETMNLTSKFFGEVRQLQQDLHELEAALEVVEKEPFRFPHLGPEDVAKRRAFLREVESTTNLLTNRANEFKKRSEAQVSSTTSHHEDFMRNQKDQQQVLLREQDEQLEELSRVAERLNYTAVTINTELVDQQRMLMQLDEDVDRETEKMNFVTRRMAKLLQTNNTGQLCLILWLIAIFIVLLLLVLVT